MAQSVNKVILVGRLGKDPEMRFIDNGAAVCGFTLATSESWNDKQGNRQEKTEWHNVSVWGKMAEVCGQHLSKGKMVYVEGKLQTREYVKDNVKLYATNIIASSVQFLSPKNEGQGQAPQRQQPTRAPDVDQVSRDMGYRSAGEDDVTF